MQGWTNFEKESAQDTQSNIIFTISERILAATNSRNGMTLWRRELDADNGKNHIRTFRGYILVFNLRDIYVFTANKGEMVLSINEEYDIEDAQLYVEKLSNNQVDESTPLVVGLLKSGETAIYKLAKTQAKLTHTFVSLAVSNKGVYGLELENGKYSVYHIDTKSSTVSLISTVSGITATGNEVYRSTSLKFYIIKADGNSMKSYFEVDFEGNSNANSISRDTCLCEIRTNELMLTASKGKKGNLGKSLINLTV